MSLKAIAKQLGISVTTVSRALNGYDDVSQETRARVEAEAQRRGYRPNTFARRLKMGTIVVVKFFWTRRSDGRVMHRRATGRQGWPAFRT
ncbi:LacI family DNA-binding transcriptional regulator, partial [Klebsiella pneumoniae]